jgi:hypothetical protein
MHPRRLLDDALAAALWFEPTLSELERLRSLLESGVAGQTARQGAAEPASGPACLTGGLERVGATTTLLRQAVFLTPPTLRPYFAVCALEAWRRVPVRHLAAWSGIPWGVLKYELGARSLTPAGVLAWNLALHATWLLDVAELPASVVVSCMHLGRPAGLAAVLGARGVHCAAGKVEAGAFAATLQHYLSVLRAAFRV